VVTLRSSEVGVAVLPFHEVAEDHRSLLVAAGDLAYRRCLVHHSQGTVVLAKVFGAWAELLASQYN
jgi:hypothetical protein